MSVVWRLLVLFCLLALWPATALGGGSPTSIVGVGAGHEVRTIALVRAVADLLYAGKPVRAPRAGYVRVFPIFYGLLGDPGRFYPQRGVLCLDGPPRTDCGVLGVRVRRTLSPFRRLALRRELPTTVRAFSYRGSRVALPNFGIAIELALDRPGRPAVAPSRGTVLRLT